MSVADFFAMSGYAFYIWGAYVVTAVLIAAEVIVVRSRFRAARLDAHAQEIA